MMELGTSDVKVKKKQAVNLPWLEKYRPAKLDDLVSHEEIIKTIDRFIKEKQLPHLLFYGPPGTGKTSTIIACAKQMYKPAEFGTMVLELNASDKRGIGVVRSQILNFASTKSIFSSGCKLIILDEADAMTNDAQNALRRIIEKYTENVRFCIICNYLSKIIPALQSRCTRFRFGPLNPQQIQPRLEYIAQQEKVNITEEGIKAILTLSKGDMRRVLHILQSSATGFEVVNEENVYSCVAHPLKSDISNLTTWLLNDSIATAFKKVQDLKRIKGLALTDILTEVHELLLRIKLPEIVVVELIIKMSDIEYRLASGTGENIQLGALVAAFNESRDYIPDEQAKSNLGASQIPPIVVDVN